MCFQPPSLLIGKVWHVMVDGCRSKLINVVSVVPQGSVVGPLLFLLYTSELFSILENMLIGYVENMLIGYAESLSRDLMKVSEWCDLWGMKLNDTKTKTIIVSRSRTMHP